MIPMILDDVLPDLRREFREAIGVKTKRRTVPGTIRRSNGSRVGG
jgi:hypothetical protein